MRITCGSYTDRFAIPEIPDFPERQGIAGLRDGWTFRRDREYRGSGMVGYSGETGDSGKVGNSGMYRTRKSAF